MLIDEHMPAWDVKTRHWITVRAPADVTYAAIRSTDLARHPVVRGMLALRALPAAAASRGLRWLRERSRQPITLAEFERQGFSIIAESPPHDLLIGLEGAFWRPGGDLRPVDATTWRQPVPAGVARAAWSFEVRRISAVESELSTETRVLCGDGRARRRFRIYWAFVGGGSGLIRRLMLRAIRAHAHSQHPPINR